MNKDYLRHPIFMGAIGLLVMTQAHTGTPVWTYSSPNPSRLTVYPGETKTLQYTVTNQSRKSKNLALKPTPGLSASSCQLATQGSTCNLTITVTGSKVPAGGIHSGPILCEADALGNPNPNQCYQPSIGNQLNITFINSPIPATQYTNIYAQTYNARVVYSFNNGNTWNPMINQQSSWFWNAYWGDWASFTNTASMTIDAHGVMYQAVQGWNGGASGQVIYSQDGTTWNVMNVAFPGADTQDVSNVAAVYDNILYVGTVNGYLLSTPDQGNTWVTLNQGNILDGSGISTLITDASGTVFAGAGTGSVYYATTPSDTWNQAAFSPSPGNTITSLAITNTNGQSTWYASAADGNVYYSVNQGQTAWTQMNINWPSTDSGDYINVLSASDNVLYAGTNNGYVFTLTPSGTNTWNAVQQSTSIDGRPITVLTVTQGTLSPLFVEGVLGSGANPQALPVNETATLTVTNYSHNTATNVQAQSLPAGVTQTPGADCVSVAPNGTCTIALSTTEPFAPQRVAITSSNISGPIEYVALVSSMNNYLVYHVNSTQQIAYVVDSADAPNSPARWSPSFNNLGISETSTSPCNGATDGYCNTGVILQQS